MSSGSPVTFRDPAGSLRLDAHAVHRRIRPGYEASTREFLRTALFQGWVGRGLMTPAREVDRDEGLELEHPRLFFISYAWEWCPAQLRTAAELTLELCEEALEAGYILKDATPDNVLFDGPRPVFVDVLSFERREPGSPLWLAQGQFVRSFLLPLLGLQHLGWPLAAMQLRRDGYEPGELYAALSWRWRLWPGILGPVTLPAWLEGHANSPRANGRYAKPMRQNPEIATAVLLDNLARLRRRVRHAAPPLPPSRWSSYTAKALHYSEADHAAKQAFVSRVLAEARPRDVLDLGANTGLYSRLAAAAGARTVAIDRDPAAVERLWQRAQAEGSNVLPLVADIARPTPALGWENAETFSLMDRLEGKFDLVLLLALLHHLLLMDQIPLEQVAKFAARTTRKHALVEWIPPRDPMFQSLLRGRDALFSHLDLDALLTAFHPAFRVAAQHQLANGRTLVLFEKR